jgi:hypothetical protein
MTMGAAPTPEGMSLTQLLEALRKVGVDLPFWRIEYLARSGALPPIKKNRKHRRVFTQAHLEAVIAAEARRNQTS